MPQQITITLPAYFLVHVISENLETALALLEDLRKKYPKAVVVSKAMITKDYAYKYDIDSEKAVLYYGEMIEMEHKLRLCSAMKNNQVIVEGYNATTQEQNKSIARVKTGTFKIALADPFHADILNLKNQFDEVLALSVDIINSLSSIVKPTFDSTYTQPKKQNKPREILFSAEELLAMCRADLTPLNQEKKNTKVRSLEQNRTQPAKVKTGYAPGAPWQEAESKALVTAFDLGVPILQLASNHNRTPLAILSKLQNFGCISQDERERFTAQLQATGNIATSNKKMPPELDVTKTNQLDLSFE